MIAFVLDKSKRTIVLFNFILQANVYSKQSQSLAVNSLFSAHKMLLCYEDACINFSIRKSNKTILIIKDVAIAVPKAISMILFFLFLWRGLGGTHRSLVAWIGSQISASALQSQLFSDFTACGSSNKAPWKRSRNRICLFGNSKIFRAKVYLPATWLPETGLETAHNAGFFKVSFHPPPPPAPPESFAIISTLFFVLNLQAVYTVQKWWVSSCHSHTRFKNEKAVCYLMSLWL